MTHLKTFLRLSYFLVSIVGLLYSSRVRYRQKERAWFVPIACYEIMSLVASCRVSGLGDSL
jgi:hypothetical protein